MMARRSNRHQTPKLAPPLASGFFYAHIVESFDKSHGVTDTCFLGIEKPEILNMITFKRMLVLLILLFSMGMAAMVLAGEAEQQTGAMHQHNMMNHVNDGRISLGLPPKMKTHQLMNMRSHLEAIQTIIGLMETGDFDKASEVAHARLGLTEDMKKMCSMFKNDDFRTLGFQFHKSADVLSETLKTKDMNQSLHALQNTMGYCVQCHATFRQ
ncbi:cytochrome C [Thiolapillus sp.]|uniref:cytochrome C n=1 Tax=Thiolapillus sp. TaxID=2017437 RepID=UPI0025EF1CFF|nr:cytochrome C [Thiolapillus sp.]